MDQGLVSFSNRDIAPPRRPYPAFVRPEEVEGTLLTLLATITDDGKDVGYPQVREWRGEDWFKDLVAACAKSWAHLGGIDLHRSAFHRPQAPNTSDGLPIYGRDQSVRWRFWPTAPLLRTDDPQDALPFCAVKDAQGKTPPSFRPRLLGFLGSAPNLFLDPKRAEAAADAAIAALDLDPAKPRSGEFPDWLAEAWRGQSPNMGAAGFFEVDIQMRAEFGGHGKLLVTPPVCLARPEVAIFSPPRACDFGIVVRGQRYNADDTGRVQNAIIAAIS